MIMTTTITRMPDIIEVVIVMRHGLRADKAGEEWSESETRPWDPPLSVGGWKEAVRSGKELNAFLNSKPDMIFTSPYTRCLQTASAVAKACDVSFKCMIVDRGLSESYDYLNTVKTVSSNDMIVEGKYANMRKWFFSERQRTKDSSVWKLMPGLTLDQRVDKVVYDAWEQPKKNRHKLRICGKFPDFEMYLNLGFNREKQFKRYGRALDRCLRELRSKSRGGMHRIGVIVTHRAGVTALHKHLLQTSPMNVNTAGYFVVCREGKGAFRLLSDRLD